MMYKHSALTFFICSTRAFSGLIFQAIALTRIIKNILTIFTLQAEHLLTCTVQLNQNTAEETLDDDYRKQLQALASLSLSKFNHNCCRREKPLSSQHSYVPYPIL